MTVDLDRFVIAQKTIYGQVLRELRAGRKHGHWMWFIFPQISGLGTSDTSQFFSIASRDEARVYAEHPLLGSRLRECTGLVVRGSAGSLFDIFGSVDGLKFLSSMTLFALAALDNAIYLEALERFSGGRLDEATLELLEPTTIE